MDCSDLQSSFITRNTASIPFRRKYTIWKVLKATSTTPLSFLLLSFAKSVMSSCFLDGWSHFIKPEWNRRLQWSFMSIACLQILQQNSVIYLYGAAASKHGLILPESCAGAGVLASATFLTMQVPIWFQWVKAAERLQRTCSASWWCAKLCLLILEAWSLSWTAPSWHRHQKLHCSYEVCKANTSKGDWAESLFSLWIPSAARSLTQLLQLKWASQRQVSLRIGIYWKLVLKPLYPRLLLFPDLLRGQLFLCCSS